MNYFQQVMSAAWQIMSIEITLYGFTFTYGQLYTFSLLTGLVVLALFKYLWG